MLRLRNPAGTSVGIKGLRDGSLLVGDSLVINAAVDERGDLAGSLLDGSPVLGDGELLEELVQNLD